MTSKKNKVRLWEPKASAEPNVVKIIDVGRNDQLRGHTHATVTEHSHRAGRYTANNQTYCKHNLLQINDMNQLIKYS